MTSGRRVNPLEAAALMERNGCRPRAPFIQAREKWPCICRRCEAEIEPTYDSIATQARRHGDAPRGCRSCADRELAERFRLSEAELMASVVAANIEPLEPYVKGSVPWRCRCLNVGCPRQGKPIGVLMKVVRAGGMACRYCAGHEIHPDDAAEMMRSRGRVEPSVTYPGIDKPWPGICMVCEKHVSPRLNDVRNGQGACIYCAPNTPLTLEQAWDRALSYRFTPDDPEGFQNTNTPWSGTCMDCEESVAPCLGNLYRGQGACNTCKQTGFNDAKPALLYLVARLGPPATVKIGICEDSPRNTRLLQHARNGWEDPRTMSFAVGLHARLVESAVKRLWFVERGWKNASTNSEDRFDGYTETVRLRDPERNQPWTDLTPAALWIEVSVRCQQMGFIEDASLLVDADQTVPIERCQGVWTPQWNALPTTLPAHPLGLPAGGS